MLSNTNVYTIRLYHVRLSKSVETHLCLTHTFSYKHEA